MTTIRLAAVGLGVIAALGFAAADDPANTVRVMTFNVRYGTARDGVNHWNERKTMLAEVVAAFDPDLLGTQEVLAFQRDYLSERRPGFPALSAGRDDGKDAGEMTPVSWREGRYEKLDGGHFWLSPTPDRVGSKGWDAALPRIATWVKLRDKTAPAAKPLLFLNTHFDHMGKKARAESAALIRGRVEEVGKDCSVVVTGDFNTGEGSEPYLVLFGKRDGKESVLVDAYRVAHPERKPDEGTFNEFKPGAVRGDRIDWIGCSRDWAVKSAAIDHTTRDGRVPSDHFPVTAVLTR
jgi:endonuclease/exonuclease/phosphatase family metal-dependent hydrolase